MESMWCVLGMLDFDKVQETKEDTKTEPGDEPGSDSPQHTIKPPVHQVAASEPRERSSSTSGLDLHSCLQFLLDLYGQFLSPTTTPRVPLAQLNATVKSVSFISIYVIIMNVSINLSLYTPTVISTLQATSLPTHLPTKLTICSPLLTFLSVYLIYNACLQVVCLSDIFTEKQQFEWMLRVLMEVHRSHPAEDDLVTHYLLVGIAKAVAVVGMVMLLHLHVIINGFCKTVE